MVCPRATLVYLGTGLSNPASEKSRGAGQVPRVTPREPPDVALDDRSAHVLNKSCDCVLYRFTPPMPDPLSVRLKKLIVETLKLDDIRADDIPENEPLFGSPRFGLDSIDALELVL